MRQLRLHLDNETVGCGAHVLLMVTEGRRYAELLHVPTLSRLRLPLEQVAQQLRSGIGAEVPIARGLISRIEQRRRGARGAKKFGRRLAQGWH